MDIQSTFRNLVINRYMLDFDYVQTRFAFQTLFYKSAYSYCCCPCGFEHEYFKYITDSGDIDEEMYKKVLSSILNGKCSHVDEKTPEYITETSVYAIQIAAVVGTEMVFDQHMKEYLSIRGGGIFKLRACEIATLRKNYLGLVRCCNELPKLSGIMSGWKTPLPPVLLPTVETGNGNGFATTVKMAILEHLEYYVQDRNSNVLRSILMPSICHEHIEKAFKLIFRNRLVRMGDALAEYCGCLLQKGVYDFPDNFAEPAIVYNQPNILQRILNSQTIWSSETQRRLGEACCVLGREDCETILSQHNFPRILDESDSKKANRLFVLLADFYDDFKDEVVSKLRNIPSFGDVINKPLTQSFPEKRYWIVTPLTPLQYYIEKSISLRKLDYRVVQTMLELGADVDSCNTIIPPNAHGLRSEYWSSVCSGDQLHYRKTLELLINENPKLELYEEAVKVGIQLDVYLKMPKMREKSDLIGEYVMNAKEHSLFGFDTVDEYPFNFIGPLLIECGFPYTKDTILFALEKQLHPIEQRYMQKCLDTPRALKLSCRDVIRKTWCGRQIHKFVESPSIPLAIKEYILMKALLRNI